MHGSHYGLGTQDIPYGYELGEVTGVVFNMGLC